MSIKKTKDAKIEVGTQDKFKDSDFEPQSIGHRISIVIPEDVLMAYREAGKEKGMGYQTVMNQVLREYIFGGSPSFANRLGRLEKAVFKKKAQP